MKTRKYFFLMLAAAVFAACSSSDDKNDSGSGNGNGGQIEPAPAVIDFTDYSSAIGMTYSDMIQKYPNPTQNFGDFYIYEFKEGKVTSMTMAVNPETSTVYMVSETLAENAYKEADLKDYFAIKYRLYSSRNIDIYDEEGENVIGKTNIYTYGNAEKEEEATLVITLTNNESVIYMNPKNVPVVPESAALEEITPVEAVASFLMSDMEDIEDEYPDAFMQMNGMYMASMDENPYLMSIALVPVDGFVSSMILLYNEELTDQDIIDYYTEQGYTVTKTETSEEETDIYLITNDAVVIEYSDLRGVVTYSDDEEEEEGSEE